MKPSTRVCVWCAALCSSAVSSADAIAQMPCRYEVSAIIQGPPCAGSPHAGTFALAISPNGRYVCGYWTCIGSDRAFVYDTQTQVFTTLPLGPGFLDERANGVNDAGMICGTGDKNNAGQRGFVYNTNTGQFTELLPQNNFPFGWSGANAINASGTVCGFRSIDDGGDPVHPFTAFIWAPTTGFFDLGTMIGPNSWATAINDSADVVGWTGTLNEVFDDSTRAFVRKQGALMILGPVPGGTNSVGRSIDNLGRMLILGKTQQTPVLGRVFLYGNGRPLELPVPRGFDKSSGLSMTDSGLVGGCCNSTRNPIVHASLWWQGEVVLLDSIAPTMSFTPECVLSIGRDARLIVNGRHNAAAVALLLSPLSLQAGDTNCDARVNVDDLLNLISHWGPCAACPADVNNDGIVDANDLVSVVEHWG